MAKHYVAVADRVQVRFGNTPPRGFRYFDENGEEKFGRVPEKPRFVDVASMRVTDWAKIAKGEAR